MTAVADQADSTVRVTISLDDIPVGEGRAVALGDEQVAVFRLRGADDGSEPVVRAVSAVCPHLGGPIADGQTDGCKVVCPLHLHTFDLTDGQSLTGQPALKVYPVEVRDGDVVVRAE